MKANNKTYYGKCVVFTDLGKKWLSMRLPNEETTIGDKYSLKFRKEGDNGEYLTYTATLYFERFTDGHILDIPMDDYNAENGEWFEVEATKFDE